MLNTCCRGAIDSALTLHVNGLGLNAGKFKFPFFLFWSFCFCFLRFALFNVLFCCFF